MAGTLCKMGYSIPYLIEVAVLEKTDNSTVTQLIISTLAKLHGSDNKDDKMGLLISDAATYMIKFGNNLKNTFTQMLHVTCLAHGLNRVPEFVRIENPEADIFVTKMKKLFKNSNSRKGRFKHFTRLAL